MKASEIVSAPRGLLKIFILDRASRYPVSGKEVSDQVAELSNGVWRPSPGSIYYILKELVAKNRLSEIYMPEKGVRKYVATEKGLSDLALFRSFGAEVLLKQASFLMLTSHLLHNAEAVKALNSFISQLQRSPKST